MYAYTRAPVCVCVCVYMYTYTIAIVEDRDKGDRRVVVVVVVVVKKTSRREEDKAQPQRLISKNRIHAHAQIPLSFINRTEME